MSKKRLSISSTESSRNLGPLVGAIDQGTKRTRFMIFSGLTAELITFHSVPVTPEPGSREGWIAINPRTILHSVIECINRTVENLKKLDLDPWDIVAVGIANQRESVVLWDKVSGEPLYPAILRRDGSISDDFLSNILKRTPLWQEQYVRHTSGIPIHSQFAAVKIKWLIDNVPSVALALKEDKVLFGTLDTWLLWNLANEVHLTDVTNASTTSLMNLETLKWDKALCSFFGIPMNILPEIRSCSEVYGKIKEGPLAGVPISGVIADQQASLIGQNCLHVGAMKASYGGGCSVLKNIGPQTRISNLGLVTTVAYKIGPDSLPVYALEGSVAFTGGEIFDWLKDSMEINDLNPDTRAESKGVYFIPALSGLHAPNWRSDSRGIILGLSRCSSKENVVKASLEAVAFQTREILEVMNEEYEGRGHPEFLLIDGGLSDNNSAAQTLSDILGISVLRPCMSETSALGAAIMAGRAEGIEVWDSQMDAPTFDNFLPRMTPEERHEKYERWKEAVDRSLNWTTLKPKPDPESKLLSSIPCAVFVMTTVILCILAEKLEGV